MSRPIHDVPTRQQNVGKPGNKMWENPATKCGKTPAIKCGKTQQQNVLGKRVGVT